MKDEMMTRLNAVLNALNAVSVSGKVNLANLSGSISVLEELGAMIRNASFQEAADEQTRDGADE